MITEASLVSDPTDYYFFRVISPKMTSSFFLNKRQKKSAQKFIVHTNGSNEGLHIHITEVEII